MGFSLCKSVVFRSDDGAEVVARPFFYTEHSGSGIKVDLFTDLGVRLQCVDEAIGAYSLGESGKLLYLKP
jgi:hypothetical protein